MSTIKISALPTASGIDGAADYLPIVQSSVTNRINRNTFLGITGNPVGTSDSQALTNKTVTSPTISSPTLSGTIIGTYTLGGTPTFPAAVVTLTGSQALTNKTITAPTITGPTVTGTVAGSATYSTPTLTAPVIGDFSSATHNHTSTATGGTLSIIAGGASSVLKDQNSLALDIEGRASTTFAYFVESGCVWSTVSGLNGTMTSGVVWINGRRISISSVATKAFTASKDTYIDVDVTGTITYTANTTNAASPALAASSIRLAIVVAGASITSVNTGSTSATAPVVSNNTLTVSDSVGNLIYPTTPTPGVIAYRVSTSDFTTTGGPTDITGLDLTCIIPAGRRVVVSAHISNGSASVASNALALAVVDVTASSTTIGGGRGTTNASGDNTEAHAAVLYTPPASGAREFKAQLSRGTNAATVHTNGSTANPVYIMVELV